MTLEQARKLSRQFTRLLTGDQIRLRRGSVLREEMWDDLEAGRRPEGYRYPWVKECSTSVIEHVRKLAERFNTIHDDDRASADDLVDILTRALDLLQR